MWLFSLEFLEGSCVLGCCVASGTFRSPAWPARSAAQGLRFAVCLMNPREEGSGLPLPVPNGTLTLN